MPSSQKLNRLNWQCRRGMLELDLILQKFFKNAIHTLTDDQLNSFEQLLNQPDPLLLAYLMGDEKVNSEALEEIVSIIRQTL